MIKTTHGVLSPEWAVKYAHDCLSRFKREKGVKLHKSRITAWIRTLREAEHIILKVGSYVGKENSRNPETGLRFGIGITCTVLREAVVFLEELLNAGRPVNVPIARAVYGLSNEFKKRTGSPNYRQVGEIVTLVFGDALPKPIGNNDLEDWARKTATCYAKLLANKESFDRVLEGYLRLQVGNYLTNPPLIYNPNQPPPPTNQPSIDELRAAGRTFLS